MPLKAVRDKLLELEEQEVPDEEWWLLMCSWYAEKAGR